MKNFFLCVLLACTSIASAETLKATMKSMNANLKAITERVVDASKNAESLALAEELQRSTVVARGLLPGSVTGLPEAEQPGRKALYEQMIDQLSETAQQLVEAFRKGDNAQAQTVIDGLRQQQKDGHREFKK